MTDTLLTDQDQKEGLSLIYAKALATRAGFATSTPTPDRNSIDLRILAGGRGSPGLDLQLKATVTLGKPQAGLMSYRLSIKNYNDLRATWTQTPRLLVVLELPKDESQWMTVTPEELVLRRRAYWMSLQGHAESGGQQTVTVHLPEQNVLDVVTLKTLIEKSRQGVL